MWGGKWFGLVADDPVVASGTTANATAANVNAANATAEKPGFLSGLFGSETTQQKIDKKKAEIAQLNDDINALKTSDAQDNGAGVGNQQVNMDTTATYGAATDGSATYGAEMGSSMQNGGKRSRRRRGRKTKRSRRSRRHR